MCDGGTAAVTRVREHVVSTWVDSLHWNDAIGRVMGWALGRESRYVCICNVHSVVTARADEALRSAIDGADLAAPDGMPVAWLIGRRRRTHQPRINGPDLTLHLCRQAAQRGVKVAFYGSTPETLALLNSNLQRNYPELQVGAMISPPFRRLTEEEQRDHIRALNDCGAGIVFVGLGCPKQEIWMAAHKGQVHAVLIGVGAAFDFMAGTVRRPPKWMQSVGLEWLGRLLAEPRRLWRRYLVTNSAYLIYLAKELLLPNRAERHDTPGER